MGGGGGGGGGAGGGGGRGRRPGAARREGRSPVPDLREAASRALGAAAMPAAPVPVVLSPEDAGRGSRFRGVGKPGAAFQRLRPVRRGGLPEPGRVAPGPVSLALGLLPPRRQPGRSRIPR